MADEIPEDVMALASKAAHHCVSVDRVDRVSIIARAILADRASDARLQAARAEGMEKCIAAIEADGHRRIAASKSAFETEVGYAILGIAAAIRKAKESGNG